MNALRWVGRGAGGALLAAALLGGAMPTGVAAQGVVTRTECRCVDRDGNEIENCSCVRQFDMSGTNFGSFGRRSQIGVYIATTQSDAEVGGARITDVMEDGPAWEAGIRTGDVVVSVNGVSMMRPLSDEDAEADLKTDESLAVQRFIQIVGNLEPEQEARMVVTRDGVRRDLTVTPDRATAEFSFGVLDERAPVSGRYRFFGEMEDSLRSLNFRFSPADQERLRYSLDTLRNNLRGMTFELREMAPRLDSLGRHLNDSLRVHLRELAPEGGMTVWNFRGDEIEPRGEVFFPRASLDPCIHLVRSGTDQSRTIIGGSCLDGVQFTEMNAGLSTYFGTADGVLVTDVAEGASLGLEPGDVVLEIGDREVETPFDIRRVLSSYEMDESITFRVRRQDREIQVSGTRRGN